MKGPIRYTIDEGSLSALPSDAARQDFRDRISAAAQTWTSLSGTSITQASGGQTPNLTIIVTSEARATKARVNFASDDHTPYSNRTMVFSDQFSDWAPESRERVPKHEMGHLLGLEDVPGNGVCPSVETIMRQIGDPNNGFVADLQLRNGYGCAQPGAPATCEPQYRLPQPPSPNGCDVRNAQDHQQAIPPAPTPTPVPTPTPPGCYSSSDVTTNDSCGGDCPCGDCVNGCGCPCGNCSTGCEPVCEWIWVPGQCYAGVCYYDQYGVLQRCEPGYCDPPTPIYVCY